MDRERWDRIQALFHEALVLPAGERRAFVESRCADDPAVAAETLAMLAEDERADQVLDRGLEPLAAGALADRVPAREIGPYRLGELLGEGGMGVVYRAERADLGNRVAIKLLRDAWLSPARRERFASEQRTLAQLDHPAIARLFDADTLPDGTPWFAMEYVAGETLTRFCSMHGLSIRQRIALFRAVCEGVLHAHQHAVIHRDLKPSNILVTRDGRPKLLDFGIAKSIDAIDSAAERTRTELRLMTPAYAAPEQFRGADQGVYTDVYSLGVILFELLTGRLPFDLEGQSPTEAAEIIARHEPEKPSAARARAAARPDPDGGASWPDLDVLCLTALQKDPARRYRSVEALIRDLDHYLKDEPLEARPDTLGYRTGKFVRRQWRPLVVAAAVVIAAIGLVTFYTLRLAAARNAAVAEARRTRSIQNFMNQMFEGGDPDAGPPDSLRVVELLARGAGEAGGFSREPAIQAELYHTLGKSFLALGQLDRADSMLSAALAVSRARLGAEGSDVARGLFELGLLRVRQSRIDEGERLVREGLALARRRQRGDPATVAGGLYALGVVLESRGDAEQAIVTLAEAVELETVGRTDSSAHVLTLSELANAHFYAGHYEVADSLNRAVLAIDRRLHGARHPNVASDLANLGYAQRDWGHPAEAERYFREALAIYRGWYGEEHYETAAMLGALGSILVEQNRLAEAREPLRQALAIRQRLYGPDHLSVATLLDENAWLDEKEGRFAEAEAGYQRELRIVRAAYHNHHQNIGIALGNLGTLYVEWKRYADAERCFREALVRYGETLPANHLFIGIAHWRLGRALLLQSRMAEAERESRAGHEILKQQETPPVSWLAKVRTDLITEYQALGRPADAARIRAEQVDSTRTPGAPASR
jgi:serine/threonine-protein kinase